MDSSLVPKSAVEAVKDTLAAVDELSPNLLQLLSLIDGPDVLAELPPLLRARTFLVLTKAATTLLSVRLRCDGIQTDDNPINKEFERLNLYEEKLERLEDRSKKPLRPSTSLDYRAATRFITHSLPDLTPEQRKNLQDISRRKHVKRPSEEPIASTKRKHQATEIKSVRAAAQEFLEKARRELLSYNTKLEGPLDTSDGGEEKIA